MSFVVVVVDDDDDVEMYQKMLFESGGTLLFRGNNYLRETTPQHIITRESFCDVVYSILIVGLMILIQKRRIKLIMD